MRNPLKICVNDGVHCSTHPTRSLSKAKNKKMKASATTFQPMIEGAKQYIVPLFQRPYTWKRKDWGVLLDDLIWLYENEDTHSHFIGSIVTMPTSSTPQGIAKYLLIDGQQRLTTIFIILALLRDTTEIEKISQKIQQTLLVNPFNDDDDFYKLLPTQAVVGTVSDRKAFQSIIEKNSDNQSLILECYHFFQLKIKQKKLDIEKLANIVSTRLSVVSIVLEHDDNPYLVFEGLNAKGCELSQADLIRNYFFMRITINKQDKIYNECWLPIQKSMGEHLTEFMRHYLTSNGMIVKKSDVYIILKERVDRFEDVLNELKRIQEFSSYYEKFINPEKEENNTIKQVLTRIKDLEVTVSYPFLLNCYHDYKEKNLTFSQLVDILNIIENFIIRRFVCNMPTHGLNKIFPVLYKNVKLTHPASLSEGIKLILQSQGYPKDNDFYQQLIECKLYGNGDRRTKTRLILEALEKSFNHKEIPNFSNLSIEHIMPQTLTKEWKKHLGDNWQEDYDLYINSLGNLTLTAYNSELSNASFTDKNKNFSNSKLSLNSYFAEITDWNKEEIQKRSEYLANTALKVWSYFGVSNEVKKIPQGVTGKKPKILIIFDQEILVKTWRDVLINFLTTIAEFEPDFFKQLVKEYPHFINKSPEKFRESRELKNGYHIEVNLSADSIYRFCKQAMQTIELSDGDWHIEIQ